jgi:aspartate kinase
MLEFDPSQKRTVIKRSIVVQKYGGSSVADVDKLGRVADRIAATRRAGNDVVVVVSAMGKTTDQLLALASDVSGSDGLAQDAPRRELDMLVSTGERVAMALLSIAIQARGLDAISFTGSQSGIITNDRHFDARIIEVRPHRIEDELARGRVVIVAGYQGMSYKREITTLGRGGSDTTAVALAAALEADRCEIYSDVDGVYSADPRQVDDAKHLGELDYATLQQMAESGAKVVCAQAVEWARKSGIALYARSTFDPIQRAAEAAAPRQTVVRKFGPDEHPRARAVAADGHIALLTHGSSDALDALLAECHDAELSLLELEAGSEGLRAVLALRNAPDWPAARERLCQRLPDALLREDVATVSVVGGGLTDHGVPLARFREVLATLSTPVHALSVTPLRLCAVIDAAAVDDAQRALHDAFVT